MTEDEIFVRKELEKAYPQLLINTKKTCGYAFEKHGLDLLAVAVEFFLMKPVEVQLDAIEKNKMINFITFIMGVQLKSGSSKFYNVYRKHHEKQRELYDNYDYGKAGLATNVDNAAFEDEEDELMECMKYQISKLNPYQQMLVQEKLIEGRSYAHISKTYNINYGSLKLDTTKAINIIKKACQHLR